MLFGIVLIIIVSLYETKMDFHEMKGYKDALLVSFMHTPSLVVLNEKNESYDFMFDADKLNQRLLKEVDEKNPPDYDLGNISYHINIIDTQTEKLWSFKNYIPVDPNYTIDKDEKNLVWRFANVKYPDGNISTVLVKAVFTIGEDDDIKKLKQGMICTDDEECGMDLKCTKGSGDFGQKNKTCQPSYCSYIKVEDDEVEHICECECQEIKNCVGGKICCNCTNEPTELIEGQPCTADAECIHGCYLLDSDGLNKYTCKPRP